MTLRITTNRNRTWNGSMISFNRNMSYMSKQIFIHFIILPSSFNIIIFFYSNLNFDYKCFMQWWCWNVLNQIHRIFYAWPSIQSLRTLLWIGFKWKWRQSCTISKICLCNEFICSWVLTLSLEEFYLVIEVLIF